RFTVEGTVVHGQGHGRKLGFPTLNIDPHHELRPPPGVYLTRTRIGGRTLPSLTNIGRPPTEREIETGLSDFLIETHLLDYEADLYGQKAEMVFVRKTRDVRRFVRESDLVRQVHSDLLQARRWFAEHPEN
ncbi:MAG: riboflavin kinase, partial [Planctomycetota bacterium]|nr:riboflavin kinase [Planctomycetota bacterium]